MCLAQAEVAGKQTNFLCDVVPRDAGVKLVESRYVPQNTKSHGGNYVD